MSILELSPEESLVAANTIALAIFRAYSLEDAIFITDFVNAIEGSLTVLVSKQGLIETNNASYKRKDKITLVNTSFRNSVDITYTVSKIADSYNLENLS